MYICIYVLYMLYLRNKWHKYHHIKLFSTVMWANNIFYSKFLYNISLAYFSFHSKYTTKTTVWHLILSNHNILTQFFSFPLFFVWKVVGFYSLIFELLAKIFQTKMCMWNVYCQLINSGFRLCEFNLLLLSHFFLLVVNFLFYFTWNLEWFVDFSSFLLLLFMYYFAAYTSYDSLARLSLWVCACVCASSSGTVTAFFQISVA